MIIDAILYNGESDIFDIRYNVLFPYVDEFVVVEFGKTFSGKDKEAHPINLPKVSYHFFTQVKDLKPDLPPAFAMEYNQREMMKYCLQHLHSLDYVLIGDVDEIWDKNFILSDVTSPIKFRLKVYSYYLNNKSNEDFILGPVWGSWVWLKDKSFNELRQNTSLTKEYAGWHFTNMGGKDRLLNKIESYGHQEFNTPQIKGQLEERIKRNEDYIGRNFKFKLDESEWPEYLKNNKEKYKHLLL